MAEEIKKRETSPPSLDQLLGDIDRAIKDAVDDQAHRLGRSMFDRAELARKGETYILFAMSGRRLAVALTDVVEIGDLPMVTGLPNLPDWLLGIINVRGEIISVIDFARFLGWVEGEHARLTRMVILRYGGVKTALRIERVLGMHRRSEVLERDSKVLGKEGALLPQRVVAGDQEYQVLDCRALFADARFVEVRRE